MKQFLFFYLFLNNILLFGQNNNSKYDLKSYTTNNTQNIEIIGDTLKIYYDIFKLDKKYLLNKTIIFNTVEKHFMVKNYNLQVKNINDKNDNVFEIGYNTELINNKQIWIQSKDSKRKKDSIITNFPTITYESFLYIIPKLDFTQKGKITKYNIVKPETFRRENENAQVLYIEDVDIKNKEIEINLKKILVKDNEEIIYIFWVNNKNEIIIGTTGNDIDKTFYRDLNINEKFAFKEIFEDIEKKGVQFIKNPTILQ